MGTIAFIRARPHRGRRACGVFTPFKRVLGAALGEPEHRFRRTAAEFITGVPRERSTRAFSVSSRLAEAAPLADVIARIVQK